MSTLNDLELIQRIDTEDMLSHIDALPEQFANAWEHAKNLVRTPTFSEIERIVICGMGGSAISGDLLAALVSDSCPVPISVHRGYNLPAYVRGPETMVIAMSHSGTTEETLSDAQQAIDRGARLLAITSGGDLAPLVEKAGGGVWGFDYEAQPRATLGWLYGLLLAAYDRLGFSGGLAEDVAEAVEAMRHLRATLTVDSPSTQNPAKHLAGMLAGHVPVIWGAELLGPVARRWKTQINENSKTAAYYEEMPELNHNSVVGLEFPAELPEHISIVSLVSEAYNHPRTLIRQKVTAELVERMGVPTASVEAEGESRLAQQMNIIQMGDYVSYYLALIYEVDPTPIANIVWLKEKLAQA